MKKNEKKIWNLTWLDSSSVKFVWNILSSKGALVYFVGGCVRDAIQGREIKDIDIATNTWPSEVVKLAESAGLKVVKTGLSHGSVSLIINRERFEVTTFRSDLVTDGRKSKVSFSSNILDDAKRRDFTMNALYMTIDGKILDPISGWKDLVNGYVKFIGDPEKRIHEDYLRVLRYFRFLTTYSKNGKLVDTNTLDACSNAVPGLKILSQNRIWSEFQQILLADNSCLGLKLMKKCGVLDALLPFADIANLQRFLAIENKLKFKFTEINRLVALNPSYASNWARNFP